MPRRQDIFIERSGARDRGEDWQCYVQGVTPANAERITASLEAEGDRVRRFTHTLRGVGRLLYQTPTREGT